MSNSLERRSTHFPNEAVVPPRSDMVLHLLTPPLLAPPLLTLIPLLPHSAFSLGGFQCDLTVAPAAVRRAHGNAGYSWLSVCQWGSDPSQLPNPNPSYFRLPALGGHGGRHPGLKNVGHISRARNNWAARVAAVVGVGCKAWEGMSF